MNRFLAVLTALPVLLFATASDAETVVEAFVSGAFTGNNMVDGLNGRGDQNFGGGVRVTAWLEAIPFFDVVENVRWIGLSAGVSAFAPNLEYRSDPASPDGSQDVVVVPITLQLVGRAPLRIFARPVGATRDSLYLYGAIGGGVFATILDAPSGPGGISDDSTTRFSPGMDARAGFDFKVIDAISTFVEWRYTGFQEGNYKFDTHHVQAGAAWSF